MLTRRTFVAGLVLPAAWRTPENFGARGDGRRDDGEALAQLSRWLNEAPDRGAVLRGRYRVGRRSEPAFSGPFAAEGALTILHPRNTTLVFEGGVIVMDNLDRGVGDQFHGIYVRGPGCGLRIVAPDIRWSSRPTARSQGDGLRFYGDPSESGA